MKCEIFQGERPLPASKVIKLNAAPTAIEGLSEGRFAVATANALIVLNAANGAIEANRATTVSSMVWDGSQLRTLSAGDIVTWDSGLNEVRRQRASEGSSVLAARGDTIIQLAPATQRAYAVLDTTAPAPVVAEAPTPTTPAPSEGLVIAEAEPVEPVEKEAEPVVIAAEPMPGEEENDAVIEEAPAVDQVPEPESAPVVAEAEATETPPAPVASDDAMDTETETAVADDTVADPAIEATKPAVIPGGVRRNPISTAASRADS